MSWTLAVSEAALERMARAHHKTACELLENYWHHWEWEAMPAEARRDRIEAMRASLLVARDPAVTTATLSALKALLDKYTSLVNCGDCGEWNPETEAEVIAARAAIARAETLKDDGTMIFPHEDRLTWSNAHTENRLGYMIKDMVDRFLVWQLPADFNPDGGIRYVPVKDRKPVGTNLLTAAQAEAMIREVVLPVLDRAGKL